MHRGGGENPHVHLVFSERANDEIERSAEQWFKRYNTQDPEKGGARKSTSTKPRDWLEQTREDWADHANRALERVGSRERISDATLETQYFDAAEQGDERRAAELEHREPGQHMGPHNIARAERGEDVDRIADAQDAADRNRLPWIARRLQHVEQAISRLAERIQERARQTWNRGHGFDRGRW